jgi:hypothetical protein
MRIHPWLLLSLLLLYSDPRNPRLPLPYSDPCHPCNPWLPCFCFPISGILVTKVFSPSRFFLTFFPTSAIPETSLRPHRGERHFVLCQLRTLTPLLAGA